MFDNYKSSKKEMELYQNKHQKSIDEIINVIKPLISDNFKGANWKITDIEFNYDSDFDYKRRKNFEEQFEWINISDKEYYEIYENGRWNKNFKYDEHLKEEYIEEPEFHIKYYKRIEKRYEYLRVYVYEWWNYGGEDNSRFDFLLSEIMDDLYLRKDKLKKLEDLV